MRIEFVDLNAADPNRNMLIRITDPDLLQKTGGIVQGMSGSPVLQNGMLVGAVTHVLINDPTRGYAIFAQTMLQAVGQPFLTGEPCLPKPALAPDAPPPVQHPGRTGADIGGDAK